jgi:hypothetical protein
MKTLYPSDQARRAAVIITDMQTRGWVLFCTFGGRPARTTFALSNGEAVPPAVAALVIADPGVVACGDTPLPPDSPCQTYRHIGESDDPPDTS